MEEERLVKAYRTLRLPGKQTLRAMADALTGLHSISPSTQKIPTSPLARGSRFT